MSHQTSDKISKLAPSTRDGFDIRLSALARGQELVIPVLVLNGAEAGPRVGISAAVHGDEIIGIQIVRGLWKSLDPAKLRGSVWLIPVANPLALEALSRNTPLDMLDLNRVFPGAPDGWFTEQLAHGLTEKFLNRLDVYIDLHAGGTFPVVDYCYSLNDEGLARSFGSSILYRPDKPFPGTTASVTVARGVPTLVAELGGGYMQQDEQVSRGIEGVRNALRHVGVLPEPEQPPPKQILLSELVVIRPRHGGLCVPEAPVWPGECIHGRVKLADIISPYSFEVLESLIAPFAKNVVVLSRVYTTRINPGDYAFMIGNLATARSF